MNEDSRHADQTVPAVSPWGGHLGRAVALACLFALMLYVLAAYGAIPAVWKSYESRHPTLALAQNRAFTAQGIPGDPINLAFVGNQEDLISAALTAGWVAADPITWASSAKIVMDSLARRANANAPVSDRFVQGRKQDLAFEQPFGPDPRKRHHARFWKLNGWTTTGARFGSGAATFDNRVGVSHLTGQVTHHIDAEVDKERDKFASDFASRAGIEVEWIEDFQKDRHGKNGGGDPFFTVGRRLHILRLPIALARKGFCVIGSTHYTYSIWNLFRKTAN